MFILYTVLYTGIRCTMYSIYIIKFMSVLYIHYTLSIQVCNYVNCNVLYIYSYSTGIYRYLYICTCFYYYVNT